MKITIKKNKLQLSALLLALSSVFVLVGCGGGASNVGSDTDDSVKAATTSNSSNTSGSSTDDSCESKLSHVEKSTNSKDSSEKDDDKRGENENDDENEINDDDDENCTVNPAKPNTSGTPATSTTPAVPTATGALGKTAWANNCLSCHGMNTGKGSNANSIMQAIANNTGGMGVLAGRVSAVDANNIAEYVANPTLYP